MVTQAGRVARMTTLLIFLATHCAFLFEGNRFRFVDSGADTSSGEYAFLILESAAVRFRFINERGELDCEFQAISGEPSEWFSLGPLRGALLGDRGGPEIMDAAWATFLGESIDRLESAFATQEGADVLTAELHRQEKLRSKEMFG